MGWIGFGLKVKGKFENDIWIGNNNSKDEWCVAYHGVGRNQESEKVKTITKKIVIEGFKIGPNQEHEVCDDIFHPGKKVGKGVYCFSSINTAELYSGISKINGIPFKTVLIVRVKSDAIRMCQDYIGYWIVNGTFDEIRPYRILYKRCKEK